MPRSRGFTIRGIGIDVRQLAEDLPPDGSDRGAFRHGGCPAGRRPGNGARPPPGRGDEPVGLLVFRQDGPSPLQRAGGRRDLGARPIPHGAGARRPRRDPHAARLPHRRGPAQRLRDRARSGKRGRRRDHGDHADAHRARAARRDGARARARQAPGHPDLHHLGHGRGCHLVPRAVRDVLRRPRRRRPSREPRRVPHRDDRGPARRDAHPVRHLARASSRPTAVAPRSAATRRRLPRRSTRSTDMQGESRSPRPRPTPPRRR